MVPMELVEPLDPSSRLTYTGRGVGNIPGDDRYAQKATPTNFLSRHNIVLISRLWPATSSTNLAQSFFESAHHAVRGIDPSTSTSRGSRLRTRIFGCSPPHTQRLMCRNCTNTQLLSHTTPHHKTSTRTHPLFLDFTTSHHSTCRHAITPTLRQLSNLAKLQPTFVPQRSWAKRISSGDSRNLRGSVSV